MLNINKSSKIILVTGASASGKSEFAEVLAAKTDQTVIYLATAKINVEDREWSLKINKHQQRRPSNWQSLEISTELPIYITEALSTQCLLIDSLGTWVANFIELDEREWGEKCDRLIDSLHHTKAEIIIVGEETGWGIVPIYPSARLFRDRLGNLSRRIANIANITYLVAGGHVLNLSQLGEPLSNYEI
ncbi:bifunctional cobalamin biosynthesis protein CobP [Chondrocystis sp. NIES-4102]|nr:bifunctional cobalamin biosynthesis protein CobP [Chondrocystis sp. NIES-4102]